MAGCPRKSDCAGFRLWLCTFREPWARAPHPRGNNHRQPGEWGNRMDDVRERFQNLHEFLKAATVQAQPQQLGLHRRRNRDRDDARAEPAVARLDRIQAARAAQRAERRLLVRTVRPQSPHAGADRAGRRAAAVLGRRRCDSRGGGRRVRHPDDAELRRPSRRSRRSRSARPTRSRSSSSMRAATTNTSTTSTTARRTRASRRSSASRSTSRTIRGASATW